ncbi:hypothetical protein [Aliiroseovarius subalbicans]|uniref:hypothetical protein n=1 Tax=Aliiroseovarius subalbicans TaxID=2925840 RepID=UPI001F580F9E|nr:hypothetical protein [Aliiroseovarius subalbicans]MCI2400693.1 hypothetical protein [Aliiroseovarius subalbicans]
MKISSQTPDQLILDHKPWILGTAMIAMFVVFFGIGIGMLLASDEALIGVIFVIASLAPLALLVFVVTRVQVIFDRPSNTITFRRRNFRSYTTDELPLSNVTEAFIEEHTNYSNDSGNTTSYRPVLRLANGGVHPLLKVYTNMGRQGFLVDHVNHWLQG